MKMDERPRTTRLDNGVRILTRRIPFFSSVSMGVWVEVGARDEKAEENGLSHFIEHMIFKGTRRRTAYQIAKEFDAAGGQTNAFTTMEYTCYHAKVTDVHTGAMADIMSDIFLNSIFDDGEIRRERPVIFQEIGMVEDSPEDWVHQLTQTHYFGDNPLGRSILGPKENVTRFDSAAIKAFFGQYYRPGRIIISAAGNLDHDRFVDLVAPAFSAVKAENPARLERCAPDPLSGVNVFFKDTEQAHICLAAPGVASTNRDRYAFSLLNTILGGNMSSRLFQKIREERGLAYSVYSFSNAYADTGMLGAYAGVEPAAAVAAVDLMLGEMKRLAKEPVTDEELLNAKQYTKGNILLSLESPDSHMVRLAQNEIFFQKSIPVQQVMDAIDKVDTKDILQLARQLVDEKRMSLTLLGPIENPAPFENRLAG